MNRKYIVGNALLWAAAIIASALVGAPNTLTLILLPSLAVISCLAARPGSRREGCDA